MKRIIFGMFLCEVYLLSNLWKLDILLYNFINNVISLHPVSRRHSGRVLAISICCCFTTPTYGVGNVLVGGIFFLTSFCVSLPWKDTSNFLAHFSFFRFKHSFLKALRTLRTDASNCFWFFLLHLGSKKVLSWHFVA